MTLSLLDRFGPAPAGRSAARGLREEIELVAVDGAVVVDVSGVTIMAPSFADELFAKLDADLESTAPITFVGVAPELEPLIRMVRRRRPAPA